MNKKNFISLLLFSYFATFLRFYINNDFSVSIIGSFLYGFIIARKINSFKKEILISGFFSCFTSFSSFINFLYELIIQGYYLKLFIYSNIIIIFNLIIMYFGFSISRKIS